MNVFPTICALRHANKSDRIW